MAKKIDISCGILDKVKMGRCTRCLGVYDPQECLSFDRVKLSGVDIVCNITNGLPFKDETIDEIICIHVLEHIWKQRQGERFLKILPCKD